MDFIHGTMFLEEGTKRRSPSLPSSVSLSLVGHRRNTVRGCTYDVCRRGEGGTPKADAVREVA